MFKRTLFMLGMLCLALSITGCQAGTPKTRKVLAEWSRGQQIGITAVNQPVSIASAGSQVYLVWVAEGGKSLHYARLNDSGQLQVSSDIGISGVHPSAPQVIVSSDGSLRVFWTDNPRIPRALFMARLNPAGQPLGDPKLLSTQEVRVSDYAVARNADDSLEIFWATEVPTEGGIYHLRLSKDDAVLNANRLLINNGAKPALQVAQDGIIHLIWIEGPTLQENNIYYATFDPLTGELGPKTRVGFYRTGTGLVSYAPVVGLDDTTVYIFWSLEGRGGRQAGDAQTFSVSFPLDKPVYSEALTVDIPDAIRPAYHKATGNLPYQQLAATDVGWPTSYLYMPATLNGQKSELGVFLAGQISTPSRSRSSMEVMWAIYANGELKGYQLPIKLGNTMRPTGIVDEQGNVHLVWLNVGGFGRYEVYYASTSLAVRARVDRTTVQDLALDFLNTAWNLAPALGFFPPVFLLWTIASLVWVVGFYFVKVEGGLERRSAQIALIIAILLYLAAKCFLMPGVLFYAPFVDRVPANQQFIPVLGTMAFTLLVALGALALYFRRNPYRSLFAAYMIFVLTDSLLSLIIYVPGWLGM